MKNYDCNECSPQHKEGFEARYDGMGIIQNPYTGGNYHVDWHNGYVYADLQIKFAGKPPTQSKEEIAKAALVVFLRALADMLEEM